MPWVQSDARSKVVVVLAVVLVLGGAAFLYSRIRSDEPSAVEVAERQESCDRLLRFNSLVADPRLVPPGPTEPVRPEAVSQVLADAGGDFDAFVEAAPSRVRDDVQTLAGALRAQPADPEIRSPAFSEARQRLQSYINDPENRCIAPTGSGEG